MTLLLRSKAGSILYGTNHAGSDEDWYEVYSNHPRKRRKAKQSIVNGVDTIQVCLSDWLDRCETSHQALDAMFAPADMCEVDFLSDFRHSYRAHVGTVVPAFQRVIASFSFPDSSLKQKRHAIRLQFMINDLLETGRYNPRLDDERRQIVTNYNG